MKPSTNHSIAGLETEVNQYISDAPDPSRLITLKQASQWASEFLGKEISVSNISYLIQYGKIRKYSGERNGVLVDLDDLKRYYESYNREHTFKEQLGDDLNWALSFDHLSEKDTTKHVHRLHPYKGKFVPQLVEYFIDDHIDDYKQETYFSRGDIVLDPFAGSGTTLVQAKEMGIHSIGIDISQFNCMIANTKLADYDLDLLEQTLKDTKRALTDFSSHSHISEFEKELTEKLSAFNHQYFPSPDFKYQLQKGEVGETYYGEKQAKEFLVTYDALVNKYDVDLAVGRGMSFLDTWYMGNIRSEIDFAVRLIDKIDDPQIRDALRVILSRTVRSCRATTHFDLATLKEPQLTTYYCWKHKKICKPIFSCVSWFNRYATDTLARLKTYDELKSDVHAVMIPGDARNISLISAMKERNLELYELVKNQKIQGIFSSPPYVGQIDYHEQHAYAYELFGFDRFDELEIGPLYRGQGIQARESYIKGISDVLINTKKVMADNFNIFLVANDKWDIYPAIAERAGLQIVNQFKRPVLNRTERDKSPYSEIIFHLKRGELLDFT